MAEGARLLSECIAMYRGFESLRLRPHQYAPLAQLDRASGYGPEGQEFESLRACHYNPLEAFLGGVVCSEPLLF